MSDREENMSTSNSRCPIPDIPGQFPGLLGVEPWEFGVLPGHGLTCERRQIHLSHVFLHHPAGAEAGQYGPDRLFHDLQPLPWHAGRVAGVERRDELALQELVNRLRVGPVLRAVIVRVGVPVDEPAVVAGKSFGPPAVADRHVWGAVDCRLHATGAARLERFARVVQPDVAALDPVSYTHLRAHETPEHLVCRLLLEKKK